MKLCRGCVTLYEENTSGGAVADEQREVHRSLFTLRCCASPPAAPLLQHHHEVALLRSLPPPPSSYYVDDDARRTWFVAVTMSWLGGKPYRLFRFSEIPDYMKHNRYAAAAGERARARCEYHRHANPRRSTSQLRTHGLSRSPYHVPSISKPFRSA